MIENLKVQNIRNRFQKKKKRDIVLPSSQWNFLEEKTKKPRNKPRWIQNAYLPHCMWENEHICNCII